MNQLENETSHFVTIKKEIKEVWIRDMLFLQQSHDGHQAGLQHVDPVVTCFWRWDLSVSLCLAHTSLSAVACNLCYPPLHVSS